jgi:hypothetical protein
MLQAKTQANEQENTLLGKLKAEGIIINISVSSDLMDTMAGPCASSGGSGGGGNCGGGSCNSVMPTEAE